MKRFVVVLLMLFVVSQVSAQAIRIATYQYGRNSRLQSLKPFADHLKKRYGYDVELKSYPTVHLLIAAMQKNQVDIAFINTSGYLLLEASKNHPMRPVATLLPSKEVTDGYRTAIIAGPNVMASKLEDIKRHSTNLRLTLVNTGSTSGNLVPRMAFANIGIPVPERSFKSVQYSDIHDAAVEAVLMKMADIAAVGYSEYIKFQQQDITNKSKMRLLWLSPEIPYGPILFNNRFGSAVGTELLGSFLNMHKENPAAFEALKSGWSETREAKQFIPINGEYYGQFKKMMGKEQDIQRVLKEVIR